MKIFTMVFLFTLAVFAMPVTAGAGHDHGHSHALVSSGQVVDLAAKKLQLMVDAGKIDATWVGAKSNRIEQVSYSQGPEWVVTFVNDKLADTSKQTLYLFYSLSGQYIAANYTGN